MTGNSRSTAPSGVAVTVADAGHYSTLVEHFEETLLDAVAVQ